MRIKKIRITIKSLEESLKEDREFMSNLDRDKYKTHTPEISFEDFNVYTKILTPKRLELLTIIKLKRPRNIKELSNIVRRDFKNVYDDIKLLENLELISLKRTIKGLMPVVSYDELDISIKLPLEAISS